VSNPFDGEVRLPASRVPNIFLTGYEFEVDKATTS
jgi:hypothetical protein